MYIAEVYTVGMNNNRWVIKIKLSNSCRLIISKEHVLDEENNLNPRKP